MRFILQEIVCYHCGHEWTFTPPLSRGADCPSCRRACKVCLNCRDYDMRAHHECLESQAEWVKYKDAGNFCSYFRAKSKSQVHLDAEDTRHALAALFGGSKTPSPQGGSEREHEGGKKAPVGEPGDARVSSPSGADKTQPGAASKAADPNEQLNALFRMKPPAPGSEDTPSDAAAKNSLQDELAKFLKSK